MRGIQHALRTYEGVDERPIERDKVDILLRTRLNDSAGLSHPPHFQSKIKYV